MKLIQPNEPACEAIIDDNGWVTIITPSGERLPNVIKADIETGIYQTPIVTVQMRVKTKEEKSGFKGSNLDIKKIRESFKNKSNTQEWKTINDIDEINLPKKEPL